MERGWWDKNAHLVSDAALRIPQRQRGVPLRVPLHRTVGHLLQPHRLPDDDVLAGDARA